MTRQLRRGTPPRVLERGLVAALAIAAIGCSSTNGTDPGALDREAGGSTTSKPIGGVPANAR